MQKRKFDELISHFNRKVSDMSIDQKYKMELLGMISAIGFAHEKELSTNLASLGTDCISRQAAIDALRVAYWDDNIQSAKDDPCIVDAMTDWAIRQVKALPPAQPKSGQWILNRSGAYCCSECMEPCASYVMMKPRDKFCKMCGTRNEVTE